MKAVLILAILLLLVGCNRNLGDCEVKTLGQNFESTYSGRYASIPSQNSSCCVVPSYTGDVNKLTEDKHTFFCDSHNKIRGEQ